MALVTISRGDVDYNINSSLASINRYEDGNGNTTYYVDFIGSDSPLELSEAEYSQFTDNNTETEELQ